ncbi:hypothetical protein [Lentibacillus sp. CBA3610]|uniref:hypothetical protein n=1 Tax=Lentibacillus sp. CBA3610 TaxID=2518176 RepID=UPI00159502BD|nr:hypothetical protein [Lentibacillus sp. CBA3610]QKY70672.1 hypothetical protein Len3610_14690 [Lentibacillus sp. CBA3610]
MVNITDPGCCLCSREAEYGLKEQNMFQRERDMGWRIKTCSGASGTWAVESEHVPERAEHGPENQNMFRSERDMGCRIRTCSEKSQTWAGESKYVP